MSGVEILNVVKKILGRVGEQKTICLTHDNCVVLYNPSLQLIWNAEGYLVELRISGKDENGNTRTFKKTLTWSPEGYLTNVSGWEEL